MLDLQEAKRFYAAVFGWPFSDYGPTSTSFADGRLAGGFSMADSVQAGGPLVVIYAVDLEQVQQAVLDNGGTIAKEAFEVSGGRRFHFRDPPGHELALGQTGNRVFSRFVVASNAHYARSNPSPLSWLLPLTSS